MTLQQLRCLIAIAECGSISAAASKLYVSQSSLSVTVRDIEQETGVTVFTRSNRGIELTSDGMELLGYARQVVQDADLMERRYDRSRTRSGRRMAVSSQHYAFCVEAFIEFAEENDAESYDLSLRETRTGEIIEDVCLYRSDVGVLYLSNFNRRVLERAFKDASLRFTPLFSAKPHVFVGEHHPLAGCSSITVDELAGYPRYSFEQGNENSFFYSEEPLAELPHSRCITMSDRGTLSNLLANHTGYTISPGVLSSEMHTGIASIPLETDEVMEVGYIVQAHRPLGDLAEKYIEKLVDVIERHGMGK